MAEEALVKVEGVSKKFCKDLRTSLRYGMSDLAGEVMGRPRTTQLRTAEFWAVRDVGFELRRGDCLGLIGRNGAGKTTLLRMLNGLIKPDQGRIEMRGRIGALIALGAGFDPILTGRENIYVNGAVLGMSKREVDKRIGEIIDFAELRDFIDSPVQSYSSGMAVRLGFSIATALDPDVLILDEVLAVGDASFRHKCYHRINRIMRNCAVILVSHSMSQVAAVANRVGYMKKGNLELFPNVMDGISAYHAENQDQQETTAEERVFNTYAPIRHAELVTAKAEVQHGAPLDMELLIDLEEPVQNAVLSFTAVNTHEQPVMNWNSGRRSERVDLPAGRSRLRFRVDPLLLHEGRYRWNLWIGRDGSIEALLYAMRAGDLVVKGDSKPVSDIPYLPKADQLTIIPLA